MPNKSRHNHHRKPVRNVQRPVLTGTVSTGQEAVATPVISPVPSKAAQAVAIKYQYISSEIKYIGILALLILAIIVMLSYIL